MYYNIILYTVYVILSVYMDKLYSMRTQLLSSMYREVYEKYITIYMNYHNINYITILEFICYRQ